MKRFEHPFFDVLDKVIKNESWKVWTDNNDVNLRELVGLLKEAHPFVFDEKCTDRGINEGGLEIDNASAIPGTLEINERMSEKALLVKEFSLPYKTSLYLLKNCKTILRSSAGGEGETLVYKRAGYLLQEITPEHIRVYDFMIVKHPEYGEQPALDCFDIHLNKPEENLASDTLCINRFTNMISVKRIGIEKTKAFRNIKTKGVGVGYTAIKYENVIHIADKEEYEYTIGLAENVDWDWRGFWRGHWRALYFSEDVKDSFGRRVVDYDRTGKNRAEVYDVPGYTWVTEHTRGDPKIAEVKVHTVKSS